MVFDGQEIRRTSCSGDGLAFDQVFAGGQVKVDVSSDAIQDDFSLRDDFLTFEGFRDEAFEEPSRCQDACRFSQVRLDARLNGQDGEARAQTQRGQTQAWRVALSGLAEKSGQPLLHFPLQFRQRHDNPSFHDEMASVHAPSRCTGNLTALTVVKVIGKAAFKGRDVTGDDLLPALSLFQWQRTEGNFLPAVWALHEKVGEVAVVGDDKVFGIGIV
jgi:hypothetical protein